MIKIFYKNVFLDNDSVKEGTYEILKRNAKCFGYDILVDDNFLPNKFHSESSFFSFLISQKIKFYFILMKNGIQKNIQLNIKKAKN